MSSNEPRLLIVEDEKSWQTLAAQAAHEAGFTSLDPISSFKELKERLPVLALGKGDAALVDGSFFIIPKGDSLHPKGIWATGQGKFAVALLQEVCPEVTVIGWSSGLISWAPKERSILKLGDDPVVRRKLVRLLASISQANSQGSQ